MIWKASVDFIGPVRGIGMSLSTMRWVVVFLTGDDWTLGMCRVTTGGVVVGEVVGVVIGLNGGGDLISERSSARDITFEMANGN